MFLRKATYHDNVEWMAEQGRKDHARSQYRDMPYCIGSVMEMMVRMIDVGLMLVVEHEGQLIGAIGATAAAVDFNTALKLGTMRFWYLHEDYQKTRWSVKMLDAIEKEAMDAGCTHWMLYSTDSERHVALSRLFERRGYVFVERAYLKTLG